MPMRLKTLIAIGLFGIAAALVVRQVWRVPSAVVPPATPAPSAMAASSAAGQSKAAPTAAEVRDVADTPPIPTDAPGDESETGAADEVRDGGVRLCGWRTTDGVDHRLPLCGRAGRVTLRDKPAGGPLDKTLSDCADAFEYGQGMPYSIRSHRGDWLATDDGWVDINEVRSAEVVVIDGCEYWLDLFNSRVVEVSAQALIVEGDTDACAGAVCGSETSLGEAAEEVRQRYAAKYPGSELPSAVLRQMEKEIAAAQQATVEGWGNERKALEKRARSKRTLKLVTPPRARKADLHVDGGDYTCCT